MGRRLKTYKHRRRILFSCTGLALTALGLALLITFVSVGCHNPLMDVISVSGITVQLDGVTIQLDELYDLGRVKQGGSYSATFTILNSGNVDLSLTGDPLVRITSADPIAASIFSISKNPTKVVKVKGSTNFTVSLNPTEEGAKKITIILKNNSKKEDFSFDLTAVVDGTRPTIDEVQPADLSLDVPTNVTLSAKFSEAIDQNTIKNTTFTLLEIGETVPVSASVSYDVSIYTAFLDPDVNLDPSTTYTVALSNEIKDLVGNPLDVGGVAYTEYSWLFETGQSADTDPPEIDSTIPTADATDVAVDTIVSTTFNEELDCSTVNENTFKLFKGTTEVSGTVNYNEVTKAATFQPDSSLENSTIYTARLTAGIKDKIGNVRSSPYEWSFTTEEGVDETPPTVISQNPAVNATGVAMNTTISAVFDEPIDPSTVTNSTFTLINITTGGTSVSGTVSYITDSLTAIFDPISDLDQSSLYRATLTTGIADISGNNLASQVFWNFQTGAVADIDPPDVSYTDPADGEIDVLLSVNITATFDESMSATTINNGTFKLLKGSIEVGGNVSYNDSTKTATFGPTELLDPTTVYTARIATGVEDVAGNPMVSQKEWSFTTEAGASSPIVIDVDPASGSIDVDVTTPITVEFSKMMDGSTIEPPADTFRVSEYISGSQVSGTVTYNTTTRKATFTPGSNFDYKKTYKVECLSGMEDIGGNSLTYFSSLFTTMPDNIWDSMEWDIGKWGE